MTTLLTIHQLSYQVGKQPILSNVNLTVEEGDWLTIGGPSGSGKSSLLKLIASLQTPTSGAILYQGKAQDTYEITTYRQEVSYCFQNPTLFGETVYDNLLFPFTIRHLPFDQTKAEDALQLVALKPDFLSKNINDLSGGERQRVALLRNLLFLPKLLLLDEVTVGLDSENKQIVLDFLEKIHQKGVTLLQITHDESELAHSKKTIWIQNGGIVDERVRR